MNYAEYGKTNSRVIFLLHGGGLSWWNYKDAAEKLSSDFRVILPILDGHSESSDDFISIEKNAQRIIKFIDENFNGSVFLIGGLSLGGQIALEILSSRSEICKFAVIESALVIPSKFMHSVIKPAFGSFYGLIQQKWFSRLQFKYLKIDPKFFDFYFKGTCAITKDNMIAFLQANSVYSLKDSVRKCSAAVYVIAGKKENAAIKKSAALIHNAIPLSSVLILPGLGHGEFSINHGEDYANKIMEIINDKI